MKRELIPTAIRTEFGEVLDDPAFYETLGAAMDQTYVAGYSDMRRARDIAIATELKERGDLSRVKWANIPTLPVRLQWARTSRIKTGLPDNTKEVEYSSQHYRAVTKADIGSAWCKELPNGASFQADGSIKKGDTTLMVCDAKDAARNAAINAKAIERQHKDVPRAPLTGNEAGFTYESAPADHTIAAPPSRIPS